MAAVHADRQGERIPARRRWPMRVNAGLGMARIIETGARRSRWSNQPARRRRASATWTSIPNSRNVIPGKVVFTVDIRSPDQAMLDAHGGARSRPRRRRSARRSASACEIEPVGHFDPVTFDDGCVKARPRRRRAARLLAPQHRLRRRPRRLLDQPRRADRHGDVPLRRRALPQRGRGDHPRNGRPPAPTCCSTRWWRRRRSWRERCERTFERQLTSRTGWQALPATAELSVK